MHSIAQELVWIDCEMTGLDPNQDELVEIAVVVTDPDLSPCDEGLELVIKPGSQALEGMNSYVRSMHESSGLLEDLKTGLNLVEADGLVKDYLSQRLAGRRGILAGNSIATDRLFINRYLPQVSSLLHYRMVDVSTIKELALRWYPGAYETAPAKNGNHRAMTDVLESIKELDYYRRAIFIPRPEA